MSRRPAPRPLSLALDGLTAALAPATTLARVQQVWEQSVGSRIAEAGRPVHERDGSLTVLCTDSVWAAELELMGPELLKRLNTALGGDLIQRLRCRTG
jgi:predicted nucleic acid-binding Zn ribbon protein